MIVHLAAETERLVREELERGHFHSVDEIIIRGIRAGRERSLPQQVATERCQAVERALDFAKNRTVTLAGVSIKELLHEGHRM